MVYSEEEGFFVPIAERRRQKRQASATTNYIDVYMEIQFAKLRSETGLQANIHFYFEPAVMQTKILKYWHFLDPHTRIRTFFPF